MLQPNLGQPMAPPPTTLHLNWQLLEDLVCGNEAFIKRIVNTFLSEAPSLEEVLTTACPSDADKLAQVAHKLKGQVAYFGVPVLHTQLDELERSARRHDCQCCEPLLLAVRQQLGQFYLHLAERA